MYPPFISDTYVRPKFTFNEKIKQKVPLNRTYFLQLCSAAIFVFLRIKGTAAGDFRFYEFFTNIDSLSGVYDPKKILCFKQIYYKLNANHPWSNF